MRNQIEIGNKIKLLLDNTNKDRFGYLDGKQIPQQSLYDCEIIDKSINPNNETVLLVKVLNDAPFLMFREFWETETKIMKRIKQ